MRQILFWVAFGERLMPRFHSTEAIHDDTDKSIQLPPSDNDWQLEDSRFFTLESTRLENSCHLAYVKICNKFNDHMWIYFDSYSLYCKHFDYFTTWILFVSTFFYERTLSSRRNYRLPCHFPGTFVIPLCENHVVICNLFPKFWIFKPRQVFSNKTSQKVSLSFISYFYFESASTTWIINK